MNKTTLKLFILALIFSSNSAFCYNFKNTQHLHNESSYQHAWCSMHNGIEEFENKDFTRVDCLTDTHAVEFDFANKWAESIGQDEHYAIMTGKHGKVVLILENTKKQMKYYKRVKKVAKKNDFDVEYITPKILNLDENGKCQFIDCKCHKNNSKKNNKKKEIEKI